jgi:hypothetical protein
VPFAGFQGGHQTVELHRAGLADGFGFVGDVRWGVGAERDFVGFCRVEQVAADVCARRESPPIVVTKWDCHCAVVLPVWANKKPSSLRPEGFGLVVGFRYMAWSPSSM